MLTMTAEALQKQAQCFMDSLAFAQFKLNGTIQDNIPIWKKERVGNVIRIYLMIGYQYAGDLTDVKIIDQDGAAVISSSDTWAKPADRGIYITFKYKYIEREAATIEQI